MDDNGLVMVFEVLHEGEALIDENDEVLTVSDTTPATIKKLWQALCRDCGVDEYYDDWQEFAIDLSFNPIFMEVTPPNQPILTASQMAAAKEWLTECFPDSEDEIWEMNEREIAIGINRYCSGGVWGFDWGQHPEVPDLLQDRYQLAAV